MNLAKAAGGLSSQLSSAGALNPRWLVSPLLMCCCAAAAACWLPSAGARAAQVPCQPPRLTALLQAPEVLAGGGATLASDVYSFGTVL